MYLCLQYIDIAYPICTPDSDTKKQVDVNHVMRGLNSNCPFLWPGARSLLQFVSFFSEACIKWRLLVSHLFLLCEFIGGKSLTLFSKGDPFKNCRMQGGQERHLHTSLKSNLSASAFIKHSLASD